LDILFAIILGLIQGLTEFLPVSSSGHIELAKAILNIGDVEGSMLMTVVLHFATALSTCVIFRKEIIDIITGVFKANDSERISYVGKIIISMIPAAIVGVLFDDFIESFFSGKVLLVGCMLLVTGLLLFFADKAKTTNKEVSFSDAAIIGVSQAIAILPGISRSGATISTSVILGVDREKAAKFSFLMVIPLIFGKMAKDVLDGEFNFSVDQAIPLGVGFCTAFIVGLLACTLMIKLVKMSKLYYFSFYCFCVGIIAITYSFL